MKEPTHCQECGEPMQPGDLFCLNCDDRIAHQARDERAMQSRHQRRLV